MTKQFSNFKKALFLFTFSALAIFVTTINVHGQCTGDLFVCVYDAGNGPGVKIHAGFVASDFSRIKILTEDTSGTGAVPHVREVLWRNRDDHTVNGTFQPNFFGTQFIDIPANLGNIDLDFIWTDDQGSVVDCDNFQCVDIIMTASGPAPPDPVPAADPNPTEPNGPGTIDPCGGQGGGGGSCTTSTTPSIAGISGLETMSQMMTYGTRTDFDANEPLRMNSCSECGGAASGGTCPMGIVLARYLIPSNQTEIGSSSPGMYFSFDLRLRIYPDGLGSNQHAATFFDPISHQTFYYESDTNGNYAAELSTYFGDFQLVDSGNVAVSDPTSVSTQAVYAVLTRHNGWEYRFELVDAPAYDNEPVTPMGRLLSIKNPQGQTVDFTYKTFTQTQLDESPRRALQIDTITDGYGNTAAVNYNTVQQAGRWVVSEIDVNGTQDEIDYLYNTNGHLETVNRNSVLSSSYTYGTDTLWQAATISWLEKNDAIGEMETIFLSQEYREWNGDLVNQHANALLGRADGADVRYMSVTRHDTTPGLYRVFYRNRLMEWNRGVSLQYFESFTQSGTGYNSYSGTLETTYAEHTVSTTQQVLEAQHPTILSPSGYQTDIEYDTAGNPEKIIHFKGTVDETYEFRQFNDKNMETYYRDRAGYVTLREYDGDYNLIRIARGFLDDTGPGSEIAQPEATQEIFGYYDYEPGGSPHVNKGMLKWTATTAYAAGAVVAPPAAERTDYIYDANNRLTEVRKPTPHGQSARPVVKNVWSGGKITSTHNEKGEISTYAFDDLGRLKTTTYPDGTTEQIRRDEVNNSVYRKDRGGAVTKYDYRNTGVHWRTYAPYAEDADLHDGSFDTLVSYKDYRTHLGLLFHAGEIQPKSVYEHAQVTYKSYDYRNRLKTSRQVTTRDAQSSSNGLRYVEQRINYVDNLVFSRETKVPGYTQREYIGHTPDEQTVRIVKTRNPSITFADNTAVMGATRVSGADPAHTIVETVRDLRGNMVQVFDAYSNEARNEFDALGRRTKSTRGFGTALAMVTETEYDADSNVTKATDAAGTDTVMTYDAARNVISRKLAAGVLGVESETLYEYHVDGRQKKTTLPSGGVIENFYIDCCGHMRGMKDPYGNGMITNLDARGQTVHEAIVEDYSSHSNLLNPTDAKTLRETTTRYRSNGRVNFRTVWKSARGLIDPENPPIAGIDGVAASEGVTTQYAFISRFTSYDAVRQRVTVDLLGGGTFVVDIAEAVDQLALPIAQGGGATAFSLPATFSFSAGKAEIVIAPDEKSMQVTISNAASGGAVMNARMSGPKAATPNKLLDWTCVLPNQVETLTGVGDVLATKQIDRDGNVVRSQTDGFGWNVASYDQDDNMTRTKFDSAGNPLEVINSLNKSTTYAYDALGRQTSITDPLSHVTSTEYDASTGRVASRTDARGNKTTIELYDELGRVRQTKDRLGNVPGYTPINATDHITFRDHDVSGNLTMLTDGEGRITNYEYDLLNRRTKVILDQIGTAPSQDTEYKYDEAGRVERVTLHSGAKREMVYEFSGVLEKVQYFDTTGTAEGEDDFSYDAFLRRTGSTSPDSVTHAYVYTERGQLDTDTTTYFGQSYVVDYDYDDRGRIEKTTYPSGRAVEYTYTNRGELDLVNWNNAQIEDRIYDALGRMTNIDRPQVDEVRTYDDANRLLTINNTNLGTATYTYDENSNKLSETFTGVLSSWSFTTEVSGPGVYLTGYDEEDRFRRFVRSGQSQDDYYGRSHIGNILSRAGSGIIKTATFNEVHQLTEPLDGINQTFDLNGNLTLAQSGITLNWQQGSDRLDQTVVPSTATAGIEGTNDYGYDADNKRVWKNITRSGATAEHTVFIYAGPNCIAEYDAGTAASTPEQEYIYGTEIDSLLQISHDNNSENLTVARNQQWSVLGLLKTSDGSIAELYSYGAFGKRTILQANGTTIRANSSYNNLFGYTSRRHDEDSGLMYFRTRSYDVETSEFLSQDPLEYADGMSLYRAYFVPSELDPTGEGVKLGHDGAGSSPGYAWFHGYYIGPKKPVPEDALCCTLLKDYWDAHGFADPQQCQQHCEDNWDSGFGFLELSRRLGSLGGYSYGVTEACKEVCLVDECVTIDGPLAAWQEHSALWRVCGGSVGHATFRCPKTKHAETQPTIPGQMP